MELHTAHHASMPEAGSPATTEAAGSDPPPHQRVKKDTRSSYQEFREHVSLTRSLGDAVEQVSRDSVHDPADNREQSFSLPIAGASRLSAAAANMHGLSNAGLDQGGVFWEHFDVADLLQVLMVSTRALVGGKPVKVEMVSGDRPLTICSDSGMVLQSVSNLLENAARYTDRGRITLILGRQQDHLTLMVTDTGKGMREAEVKRVTARMNYRDGRRRPGRPAFGTGLTLTRSLVGLLGGNISLASRWNEGTIVEVRLPIGPSSTERASGRELTARSCA